jgi:galactokinase
METLVKQIQNVSAGQGLFASLYAPGRDAGALERAKTRAVRAVEQFASSFADVPHQEVSLYSAPGRVEIGGNHTDHQHGCVLCGAIHLDMLCCAGKNGLDRIRVVSEGFSPCEVSLSCLDPDPDEYGTTVSLIRGIASQISALGYPLSGADLYLTSEVPPGSGLSSSAAFEIVVCSVFNSMFCANRLTSVDMAKIGAKSENLFFGKPSGLMDQLGCSVGGVIAVDFSNLENPNIRKITNDPNSFGYSLCLVDTRSDHQDLTDNYAAIPTEMGSVARFFGSQVLSEVPEPAFRAAIPKLRPVCGDRAVLRAIHFYAETKRAVQMSDALSDGNFQRFLSLVTESGLSSALCLENTFSIRTPDRQAIPLALEIGRQILNGAGAIRVHGGGFAGAVQAFVPLSLVPAFQEGMEQVFGPGCCLFLSFRSAAACQITF